MTGYYYSFFIIFSGFLSAVVLFAFARHVANENPTLHKENLQTNEEYDLRKMNLFSIIIPARNEEANIGKLLESIKKQNIKPLEIIVVDDFSTDKTAEIAKKYDAGLIMPEPLPEGWTGKNWACYTGAQKAKGQILVFVDADVEFETGAIEKLLYKSATEGAVVSVQPYHKIKKFYENISVLFNMIAFAGINSFTIAGRLFKPKGVYGPVMAIPAEKYFASGGHKSVNGYVLEDMEMGRVFADKGFKIYNYGGKGSINFRMYPEGFKSLIEGWSKNFASGASGVPWQMFVLIYLWIACGTSIFINMASAGFKGQNVIVYILLYAMYCAAFRLISLQLGNFRWYTSFFYPFFMLCFIVIFLYSIYKKIFIKKVQWKGREIKV